jgi:SAM-dependent methyltransferase
MFEQAVWKADRMELGGLLFRLEQARQEDWDGGADYFRFYKLKGIVDEYESFFRRNRVAAKNVLELGMWDGGSLAFWFEGLNPTKLVGVDISDREDSAYFRRYVEQRKLSGRISTYWKTSQADCARLSMIVRNEFDGPLDLVFDDASHLYGPTKSSFETIFPLLRPGGLYIIEDWAWRHWPGLRKPREWNPHDNLTRLVIELTEAAGTADGTIANLCIHPSFVAVERGARALGSPLRLADHIHRRSDGLLERMVTRIVWGPEREALAKLKQKLTKSG